MTQVHIAVITRKGNIDNVYASLDEEDVKKIRQKWLVNEAGTEEDAEEISFQAGSEVTIHAVPLHGGLGVFKIDIP